MNRLTKALAAGLGIIFMYTALSYTETSAAIMSEDEIYPLFDVKGKITIKVPDIYDTASDGYETYEFKIIEENRPLTCLTCLQEPADEKTASKDRVDILFADGKCIIFHHDKDITVKRVYTDYTVDIRLDGEIPAEGGRYRPGYKKGRDIIKGN